MVGAIDAVAAIESNNSFVRRRGAPGDVPSLEIVAFPAFPYCARRFSRETNALPPPLLSHSLFLCMTAQQLPI